MANSRPQFDIGDSLSPKFQQALQQALPLLEMLAEIGHTLRPEDLKAPVSSLCEKCTNRKICIKPCAALKLQLPKAYGGKGYKENATKIDLNYFQDSESKTLCDYENDGPKKLKKDMIKCIPKITSSDIFEEYERYKDIFSKKQWRIVCLYYCEDMTQEQIAKKLGIPHSFKKKTGPMCGNSK